MAGSGSYAPDGKTTAWRTTINTISREDNTTTHWQSRRWAAEAKTKDSWSCEDGVRFFGSKTFFFSFFDVRMDSCGRKCACGRKNAARGGRLLPQTFLHSRTVHLTRITKRHFHQLSASPRGACDRRSRVLASKTLRYSRRFFLRRFLRRFLPVMDE